MTAIQTEKQAKNTPAAAAAPVQKPVALADLIVKSRFVRMAPPKIRLVARQLIGQELTAALNKLKFIPRRATKPLELLLKNGLSQAKDKNFAEIWVKNIIVDEGPKLKRRRIIHRGRATSILKRQSHITLVLTAKSPAKPKAKNRHLK
jgi:large subunit ribosomal protein L22